MRGLTKQLLRTGNPYRFMLYYEHTVISSFPCFDVSSLRPQPSTEGLLSLRRKALIQCADPTLHGNPKEKMPLQAERQIRVISGKGNPVQRDSGMGCHYRLYTSSSCCL